MACSFKTAIQFVNRGWRHSRYAPVGMASAFATITLVAGNGVVEAAIGAVAAYATCWAFQKLVLRRDG